MEPRSLSLWPGFHWPNMQAFLQATAETRAAPLPLPSSDSMKVISQLGVSLRTLAWNRSLKLNRRRIGLLFLLPPFKLHHSHPSIYGTVGSPTAASSRPKRSLAGGLTNVCS